MMAFLALCWSSCFSSRSHSSRTSSSTRLPILPTAEKINVSPFCSTRKNLGFDMVASFVSLVQRTATLDQGYFVTAVIKQHVIHERSHEQQSAPTWLFQVQRIGWIGQASIVESAPFVPN